MLTLPLHNYCLFQQSNSADRPFATLQMSAALILMLGALTFFTVKCFRLLAENRHVLSAQTISLYYTLLYLLVADIAAASILEAVPRLVKQAASALFAYQHVNSLVVVTMIMGSLYPLVTNAALLFYVKPYRRAVVRLVTMGRYRDGRVKSATVGRSACGIALSSTLRRATAA